VENLKAFAVDLDLDASEFNECMDSEQHREQVLAETNMARQIGVNSTPAFAINGTPVMGAQPFENFQQVIEASLQETGQ
jgi:predicted DsbA family dithiol-disulfide isomerase